VQRFNDQAVVITGGRNALSTELAQALRTEGARVHESETVTPQSADQLDHIDILITNNFFPLNAYPPTPTQNLTPDVWREQHAALFDPVYAALHIAGRHMLARGVGCIVNIGPVQGLFAQSERAAYSAAAAGMFMLTKALAVEWAAQGVRVNALACITETMDNPNSTELSTSPDPALLSRLPIGRLPTNAEIIEAVLFLASDEASFVTGEVLRVDGGWTAYHLFYPFESAF